MGRAGTQERAGRRLAGRGNALVESREVVRGTVARVIYSAGSWMCGILKTSEGHFITFAGNVSATLNQPVALHGEWTTHAKYGKQFAVSSLELDTRMDVHGLARYLASNPLFRGIGPAHAQQIAEHFGENFEAALLDLPEEVARVARVPVDTVLALQREWQESAGANLLMTELAAFELTHHQAVTLARALGNNAVALLRENPYRIIGMVAGFAFKRIDEIARRAGIDKEDANRLDAGVRQVIAEQLDEGHVITEYAEVVRLANVLLILDGLDSIDLIAGRLDGLINGKSLATWSTEGAIYVGLPDYLDAESEIAGALKSRGANPGLLEVVRYDAASPLNERQREAVTAALTRRLSVVTGPAGTGKTFCIRTICDLAEEAGFAVILAASTGKAAKRMEESTGRKAQTVHRLIGYGERGTDLLHLDPEEINADLLVVDESSMVDTPLALALLRAVDWARTSVVFVGDHNQLPPVGPGAFLRDLIETRPCGVTILDVVERQAGDLERNSTAILSGEVAPEAEKTVWLPGTAPAISPWYVHRSFPDQPSIRDAICGIYESCIPDPLPFDRLRDIQVLTPTHKGEAGTMALNAALQVVIQRVCYGRTIDPAPPGKRARPLLGDRVIHTRNNYGLGVMNGAVGRVVEDLGGGKLVVLYAGNAPDDPGEFVEYEPNDARELQLAYAMTIHKAQGSEFPCVITVLTKGHTYQHHRNLLYTAVTRAQTCSIILGDAWAVRNCASRVQSMKRRTLLSMLLRGL